MINVLLLDCVYFLSPPYCPSQIAQEHHAYAGLKYVVYTVCMIFVDMTLDHIYYKPRNHHS